MPNRLLTLWPLALLLVLLAACVPIQPEGGAAPEAGSVTGTVIYRERVALPEGAVVTVRLQDISRADAAAVLLDEVVITTSGEQVPIPFALAYDPSAIDERFTYAVSARIEINGRLAFINDTVHPVITRGAPTSDVELLVVPAGS